MPTATADHDSDPSTRTAAGGHRRLDRIVHRATEPVSAGSTIAFRVAFGALIAYSSIRFLWRGWVDEFYLDVEDHLTYPAFDWVQPWPAPWMHLHVGLLAVLGVLIAAGVRTRLAAGVFAVAFTYVELIDRALYLNHYWFMTLAAVLLAMLPEPTRGASARTVSRLTVWALRFQLGVVYVFAGVAKINPDWLWHGEPLQTWLAARTDRPVIGPLLDEPFVAPAASWAGALFDLTIVGWLLWWRSRPIAYSVLVVFHVATAMLFQIGVFPWVMIALTPIFFEPDWPQRLRDRLRRRPQRPFTATSTTRRPAGGLLAVLAAFAVFNVVVPLRHWWADGNVRWNDDGYEFSWRVMLTDRVGHLEFDVIDPASGRTWRVGPELVLTEWQIAEAQSRPALALHTAHLVAEEFAELGHPDVRVHADSFVAMNGRLRQRMIDPDLDLAGIDRAAPAASYVLALDPPVHE